jgi:hypothetical protein
MARARGAPVERPRLAVAAQAGPEPQPAQVGAEAEVLPMESVPAKPDAARLQVQARQAKPAGAGWRARAPVQRVPPAAARRPRRREQVPLLLAGPAGPVRATVHFAACPGAGLPQRDERRWLPKARLRASRSGSRASWPRAEFSARQERYRERSSRGAKLRRPAAADAASGPSDRDRDRTGSRRAPRSRRRCGRSGPCFPGSARRTVLPYRPGDPDRRPKYAARPRHHGLG